jgi:hypothetical protein
MSAIKKIDSAITELESRRVAQGGCAIDLIRAGSIDPGDLAGAIVALDERLRKVEEAMDKLPAEIGEEINARIVMHRDKPAVPHGAASQSRRICGLCYELKPGCLEVWMSPKGRADCTHPGAPISACPDCRKAREGRFTLAKTADNAPTCER